METRAIARVTDQDQARWIESVPAGAAPEKQCYNPGPCVKALPLLLRQPVFHGRANLSLSSRRSPVEPTAIF